MRPQYDYYDFCREGQIEEAFHMIEDHHNEWTKEDNLAVVGRGLYTAMIYNRWVFCEELIKHYPKECAPVLVHPDIWKGVVLHSDLQEGGKLMWLSTMLPLIEHLPEKEQHQALFVSYNMFMSMPRRGRDFCSVHQTFVESVAHFPVVILTNTARDIVLHAPQADTQAYFLKAGFLWFADTHSQASGSEMKEMNDMIMQSVELEKMMMGGLTQHAELHPYFIHHAPELWALYEKHLICENLTGNNKKSGVGKKM